MIPEKINKNIAGQLEIIDSSISWASTFEKDSFPKSAYTDYRRRIKKIRASLDGRCSVAAYGESQVGKSYLMSSLLSSPSKPFVIVNNGKEYSFIDDLNPSGGNTSKIESTGLVTRFTLEKDVRIKDGFIKASMLSVTDIVLMFVDSYYRDVHINPKNAISTKEINNKLNLMLPVWTSGGKDQTIVDEDNILDIRDYMNDIIGRAASDVLNSDFFPIVAANIRHISVDRWVEVFGLLWNCNETMSGLFSSFISEYRKLAFSSEVMIPFQSVLRSDGTLLMIQWLDLVCGQEGKKENFPVLVTDVYGMDGNLLSAGFSKAVLSACISEITFVLPADIASERRFMDNVDLLDFPGARTRLHIPEAEMAAAMPEIFRRGKVAYLFNKYSRNLGFSSILYCHHNDQKTEPTIGDAIKTWLEEVIGDSPKKRAEFLATTGNVSPLFMIATKFNIDLSMQKVDAPGSLSNHWRRFTEVIPEIIGPYQWFEHWVDGGTGKRAFQHIFPLRDFYWSGSSKSGMSYLFDGYSDGTKGSPKSPELRPHIHDDFPGYFQALRKSFLENDFVQAHFANPEQTWEDVATLNNDGSKAIIRSLDMIAPKLERAREEQFEKELLNIQQRIRKSLEVFYEPEDDEQKLKKLKMVTSRIRARLFMSVGSHPEIFGKILDSLMVEPSQFRKIARDILVLKKDAPKDFSAVNFLRASAGIDPKDGRDANLQKLLGFFGMSSRNELESEFAGKEFTIDDIISGDSEFCATVSDVLTKHIIDFWGQELNRSAAALEEFLPFTDEVVAALRQLVVVLGIKKSLAAKIDLYEKMFNINELLNAIADLASLELNNFVSTVGRRNMTDDNLEEVKDKAARCGIEVDLTREGIEPFRQGQSLEEVLDALDASADIMRKPGFTSSDMQTLRHLPLWDNFQRWQNLLTIGLIYASGVSTKDPRANLAVKALIDKVDSLYA